MAKRNRKQSKKGKTDSPPTGETQAPNQSSKSYAVPIGVAIALLSVAGFLLLPERNRPPVVDRSGEASNSSPEDSRRDLTGSGSGRKAVSGSGTKTSAIGSGSRSPDAAAANVARLVDDAVPEGTLEIEQTTAREDEQNRVLDPRNDGWDSEALSELAQKQYKELSTWISEQITPSSEQLGKLADDDFQSCRLRPVRWDDVYEDGIVKVRRGAPEEEGQPYRGPDGLGQALAELGSLVRSGSDIHVKFKHYKIAPGDSAIETSAYFHLSAQLPSGPVEENSTWHCRWTLGGDKKLHLAAIRVVDFEQITTKTDASFLFADCTESALGKTSIYREQLRFGVDYWRNRYPANLNIQYHGHLGLAVGDVNNDGREDIYLCQPGALPNALLLQQEDGTVRDVAAEGSVDFLNYTRGALLVDFDNDGNQDLAAGVTDQFMLLAGDGKGHFTVAQAFPEIKGAYSLAAADFDGDGDLDLYICRYQSEKTDKGEFPVPYPYYDANNGGRNVLLRNDTPTGGSWKFTDATDSVGLDTDNSKFSFAASWDDFDNDGDLDLYVANDFGRNCLYRNDDGIFVSGSSAAGLDDTAFGMSVTWGDFNRDGAMDLYVGNMFSAAGNRITFQPQFKPEVTADVRSKIQRTARGNSLFQNQGDGTFTDVSVQAAVTMGRWTWGSIFADLNNDGWEDLVVTNGNVTGELNDDL